MKKNIFIISGLILLLFVWTTASYAEEKIGFVNMQDILLNSNAGKRAEAEFKKIVDRKQASIKAMEKEIPKAKNKNFYLWKILSYSIKVKNEAKVKGMKFWHNILNLKKIASKECIV